METVEVFLVEDNPADVLLVRVALSQVPFPLKLLVAKDGEQALQMLGSPGFQPSLIILDLNMPRVDGQTVLQQYRQEKIPIVIFSSTQNKVEVQKALALGAREYVQKPIGFEPYAAAVRGIIKRWIMVPPEPVAAA
ncbi:MAG TPA: response regulator [Bryobacteraceae bacterium]|jgi:CheY-like chemotaxis protein|nr:response regulator [Bryobacteraceae bacterium]